MRLTLRTLLAYLDDVLEPATLKEIGTRVSESAPAAATVARIKEVVRRRRIAAPELTGSGSAPDPNLVAEYLDNTLSPDAIPALEKLCLDSDMHLAEVASSHQILTAVLGEPVEVPVSTRERMYALVSHAPPVELQQPERVITGTAGPVPDADPTPLPSRSPMTPDYLKSSSGWKFLMGALSVCVIVGWLGWVLKDQGLLSGWDGQSVAVTDPPKNDQQVPARKPMPDTGVASPGSGQTLTAPPTTANPVDQAAALATHTHDDMVGVPGSIPPVSELAVPDITAPAEIGLAPQPEPPVVEPAVVFPAMLYVNAEGILLSRDQQTSQWNVMPRRALVHSGDELASPDPFVSEFSINGTTLEMTLFGGTRVRLEPGDGTSVVGVSIDRGRIAVRRPVTDEDQAPVSVGLNVRGQTAVLILQEPGSHCGIEVEQRAPEGRRPDPLLALPKGGIHVVSGTVSVAWNGGPPVTIGAGIGWAGWPVPPHAFQVGPQQAIPHWLTPEGIPLTAADKTKHRMFEREFAVDQSVDMSIPPLVSDRREHISSLATYTLGLVDDVPMLVKALQSEHEATRLAAIWNLRGWLPTDPNNTALLEMEVSRLFPDDADADVAAVVNLLWGYSVGDAKDQAISQRLVAWMDDSEIAIRELAFYHVSRLTSRTTSHGYRPNLASAPRNAALVGWRNMLERNGGQLVK